MSTNLWLTGHTAANTGLSCYSKNVIWIDSNGYIHIADTTGWGTNKHLYYIKSENNGSSFDVKTDLNNNLDYIVTRGGIVVDNVGNRYAFYGDLSYYKYIASWGGSNYIDNHYRKGCSALVDNDDNILIIGGEESGGDRLCYSHSTVDGGSNWVNEIADTSYGGAIHDIDMDDNQNMWVIHGNNGINWNDGLRCDVLTKTEGSPDSWARTNKLGTTDNKYNFGGAILCERNNNIVWVFCSYEDGDTKYLKYNKSTDGGSNWGGWITLESNATYYYVGLQAIRNYDNKIWLKYEKTTGSTVTPTGTVYIKPWNGNSWETAEILKTDAYYCNIQKPHIKNGENIIHFTYVFSGSLYYDSFTPTTPQPEIIESDSFSLSDSIELNLSLEKSEQSDTFNLSDSIYLFSGKTVNQEDIFNLGDAVDLTLLDRPKKYLDEGFSLNDEIDIIATFLSYYDIDNKVNIAKRVFSNILNKINSAIQVFGNINNKINIGVQGLFNINNKINTQKLTLNDIKNDVRFVKSFQIAGDAGFQSLGKEYIKVYIDDIEQTDIEVDSITISQNINASHTCDFTLAREYDSTAPSKKSIVEIKYHTWRLYKGYITEVSPGDSPESIKIMCQDKYWEENLTNEYFYVGHDSGNDRETYYNTIAQGLSVCGASFGIGGFVPQTINCDGVGNSDAITSLVTKAGNYGWYYDENNVKKLWTTGQGDIINLEPQELEKNVGLHQVIGHTINESISELVNKFKVQMGDRVTKKFSKTTNTGTVILASPGKQTVIFNFVGWEYKYFEGCATPKWDSGKEKLSKNSSDGRGWDNPKNGEEQKYNDVFVRYHLPELDSMLLERWTNRYPPEVSIANDDKLKVSGFTLDYENNELILTQPIYNETKDKNGETSSVRRPILKVKLWKKIYHPSLDNINYPGANPETDITNPLMFFTSKMGNYPETILKPLNLSSFSIQSGGSYKDSSGKRIYVPSWNDTSFAKDYANWQLSQKCDIKKTGSITLTIDAMKFYGIELNKRIRIDGIIAEAINIKNITYNVSEFTATINLENGRYYNRTTSLQWHGG